MPTLTEVAVTPCAVDPPLVAGAGGAPAPRVPDVDAAGPVLVAAPVAPLGAAVVGVAASGAAPDGAVTAPGGAALPAVRAPPAGAPLPAVGAPPPGRSPTTRTVRCEGMATLAASSPATMPTATPNSCE